MNILFYIEPWIEKSTPTYRKHSFWTELHDIIRALLASNSEYDVCVACGDGIYYSDTSFEDKKLNNVKYAVFEQQELRKVSRNYKDAANKIYNDKLSADDVKQLVDLYQVKTDGFDPDLVVAFECNTRHLNRIYPKAKVLTQTFGVFSRYPFPRLYCFDPKGIFRHSLLSTDKSFFDKIENTQPAVEFMDNVREMFFTKIFSENDPTKAMFYEATADFNKVVMLPLQGSAYFAFEENNNAVDQFDYICSVMEQMDPRVGVLVTEHTARERVVSDKNIEYLRSKFKNFIYIPELNNIKFHSQFLMMHVDGVVFTSTAVGFLGALMGKPVFQVGTYQSFISSGNELSNLYDTLVHTPRVNKDGAFHYLFSQYYLFESEVKDPAVISEFFNKVVDHYDDAQPFDVFEVKRNDEQLLSKLEAESRVREHYVKNVVANKQLLTESNDLNLVNKVTQGKVEVISFDIFDTLIERPFNLPSQLFKTLEERVASLPGFGHIDFARERIMAEKSARKVLRAEHGFDYEVTLDLIYQTFAERNGVDEVTCEQIKQMELDAELYFCQPQKTMSRIFALAASLNKKVVITSDTYFSSEFIRKLLAKCGYQDGYTLFCSSETGVRKQDGKLFEKLIEDLAVQPNRILHIGDNGIADIKMAKQAGLQAYHITKSADGLKQYIPRLAKVLNSNSNSTAQNIITGVTANKIFNESVNTITKPSKSLFMGDPKLLGFVGLGSMVYNFCKWLIDRANAENIDTLYFLSREGLIFKKVYDQIAAQIDNAPKSEYLLASRRALLVSSIYTVQDALNVVFSTKNTTTIAHIFERKLGLDKSQIDLDFVKSLGFRHIYQQVSYKSDSLKIKKLVEGHEHVILASAANERELYLEYLAEKGLKKGVTGTAVVDIGYAGTMQSKFCELLDTDVSGLYLATHISAKPKIEQGLICDGFLFQLDDNRDLANKHRLNNYMTMMEYLLSSPEGSFVRFTRDSGARREEYVYSKDEARRKELIIEIQKGIMSFAERMLIVDGSNSYISEASNEYLIAAIMDFFTTPSLEDAAILYGSKLENALRGEADIEFLPTIDELTQDPTKDISPYIWKEGTILVSNVVEFRKSKNAPAAKAKVKPKKKAKPLAGKLAQEVNMDLLVSNPNEFWKNADFSQKLLKPMLKTEKSRRLYRKYKLSPKAFFCRFKTSV